MTAPPSGLDERTKRQSGTVGRALVRMFMKHAHVSAVESVAGCFRLITLESPEFRGVHWAVGQKLQIAMGSAFVSRTFTPIEWDAREGRTRILGYAHGSGPGSAWICSIKPGDECDVFGPRASLDLSSTAGMFVLLGDETSIGLAYALGRQVPRSRVQCLIEANVLADTLDVLARLDLDGVDLFERMANDAHLADVESRLLTLVAGGASFILTGKAPTIQRLRGALKSLGVSSAQLMTKPYWAPGKTGLD